MHILRYIDDISASILAQIGFRSSLFGQILSSPILIMLGARGNNSLDVGLAEFLKAASRDATPQFARGYFGSAEHKCASSYNRARGNMGIVEHSGAHAYEHVVVNLAAMQTDVVTHGDVVAYLDVGLSLGAMQASTVLYGYTRPDANLVDVATNDGTIPDRGFLTDHHITDDGSGWGDKCATTYAWTDA